WAECLKVNPEARSRNSECPIPGPEMDAVVSGQVGDPIVIEIARGERQLLVVTLWQRAEMDWLKRCGCRPQLGLERVITCAFGAGDLEEIGPGRQILVDPGITIAGREAIALDEELSLSVEQSEPCRDPSGMDLRD